MTYKKIAEIANVSTSTVSKALSGSKEVREELRDEIIKIAIEQGYFEEKGRRKVEYKTKSSICIAIICPEIISIAYAGIITSMKKAIEEKDGLVSIYVYDFDNTKLDRIIESITVRNSADGIILFPTENYVTEQSIPMIGICNYDCNYDTVYCDIDTCFCDIVKYLKNLGHEQIAFVGEENTPLKLRAYKRSLEKNGIAYEEEMVYMLEKRFEDIGYEAVEQMLQRDQMPTAVICAYDEIALAMVHSFQEKGIQIPEQVSIIGMNDIPMAAYAQIPLTTVRIFWEDQGVIAVNLLYDKIMEKTQYIQHITIKHKLIERKSTGIKRTD